MKTIEEIRDQLIEVARRHEEKMMGLRDALLRQRKSESDSRLFQLYVGKMFGMIEMLEEMGVDAAEFHWAYKYGI